MGNYKDDLLIDKDNLDEEWELQAIHYIEWAEKAVEAEFDRDKKKESLELVRAKCDSTIRAEDADRASQNPKYKKMTEASIVAMILQDSEYKQANTDYIEAVRQAKVYRVAETAFEHRKKALEKLTDLYISGYWARPAISTDKRRSIEEESSAQVRKQLNEDLNKTGRRKKG